MNKSMIVCLVITIVGMAFMLGYKVGDSRGYTDGYAEGYRYDCREEIGNLYEQIKNTSKAVEFTDIQLRALTRANDSLRRPGVYDSMRQNYVRDSIKYHKVAKRLNDSINQSLFGRNYGYNNFIMPNGRVNQTFCLMDSRLKNSPYCKDGWRIAK